MLKTLEKKVKLCKMCGEEKPVEECFYRAGISYQKYCKPCHNIHRKQYKVVSSYQKKGTGFSKLSEETQKDILQDINKDMTYKDIAKKYNINYKSLLYWKSKGLIKL